MILVTTCYNLMYFMSIYFLFTEGGSIFDVIYFVVFVLGNEITYV